MSYHQQLSVWAYIPIVESTAYDSLIPHVADNKIDWREKKIDWRDKIMLGGFPKAYYYYYY